MILCTVIFAGQLSCEIPGFDARLKKYSGTQEKNQTINNESIQEKKPFFVMPTINQQKVALGGVIAGSLVIIGGTSADCGAGNNGIITLGVVLTLVSLEMYALDRAGNSQDNLTEKIRKKNARRRR